MSFLYMHICGNICPPLCPFCTCIYLVTFARVGGGGLASFHQAGDIRNVRNCLGRKVPINWCINSYCFQEIIAVHAEQVDKKEIKNHLRITYIYIYILQLSYLTEIQFVWANTKCVLNYWFKVNFLKRQCQGSSVK